uniref:Toll-like receptor 2 n=1 Tax=Monopterus albus TaxID=43700 RepID=A0A3Q3ISG6_MONAL
MGRQAMLYFTLLSLCWGQRSNPDGGRSSCNRCDRNFSCNCSNSGFTCVPTVTDQALFLDLSLNNISRVMDDDLTGHTRLRALSLHGNRIDKVTSSAFNSLWSLEELDLSDNQLITLNYTWFSNLGALRKLNLLNNPYSCLGSPPVFQELVSLRRLAFGGPYLEELKRGDLSGVTELEELTVHGNNLMRYESGTLGDIWPLGRVSLSLYRPFLSNIPLASAVLRDVSYPETPIILEDLYLNSNQSIQPLREAAKRRVRHMTFHNVSTTDKGIVDLLVVLDGVPLSSLFLNGITVYRSHFCKEFSRCCDFMMTPKTVTQYSQQTSNLYSLYILTTFLEVFVLCPTSVQSLSTVSQLVENLKLTHLDISRTGYSSMPQGCSWPSTLRYLNISGAKLTAVTPCLPTTLEVLDLSNNDLRGFTVTLPALTELHLSGNKFLRLPSGSLFPNVHTLTIQSNTLNMFSRSDIRSYRRLQKLQAGQNKFVCSCDFVAFLQSGITGGENIDLTDGGESYVCDSPLYLQGELVGRVHLSIAVCHRVLFVSVSCGVGLFVGILVCVLLWHLHAFWYLKMMWAWLKAKRSSRRRRLRDTGDAEALLSFDAFVSYSERDTSWVENFLPRTKEQKMHDFLCPTSVQSLSTVSQLVENLKLTHLDISRTGYSSMPQGCSWPSTLRYLNISGAKLTAVTPCLPTTLEVLRVTAAILTDPTHSQQSNSLLKYFNVVLYHVQVLDLSNNDLRGFTVTLPALTELHLSGNKFLRLPSGSLFPNVHTLTIQVRNSHISYVCIQSSLLCPV